MVVRLTKARHEDRPHTFTCIRDDGTTTGMASTPFFVRHDLTHFAVETVLNLTEAFYGLMAQGWEIDAFGEREVNSRKIRKPPPQAIFAEIVVGALDLDWAAGPLHADETVSIIHQKLAHDGIELAAPTSDQIEQIRDMRSDLLQQWQSIEPGLSLDLTFSVQTP